MAKLYFYYSAMNAGKSTTLLQSAYNYAERGMHTLLLTPIIDTRSSAETIKSRIGLEAHAIPFDSEENLHTIVKKVHKDEKLSCVLVDEAQFMTKDQVEQLAKVTNTLGIPVLAYGIRTDFVGEPFPGSKYLLSWADELVEIKTICHCGKKATMNMRIDEKGEPVIEGDQVDIGGNDKYIATCRTHFAYFDR